MRPKRFLACKNIDEVLTPLADQFGEEKAIHIEKLLKLQARLGILRKSLDKLQDEDLLRVTPNDITEVRTEMDEARSAIGSYAMLFLRGVFPEDDSPLWGQLESITADAAPEVGCPHRDQLGSTSEAQTRRPQPPGFNKFSPEKVSREINGNICEEENGEVLWMKVCQNSFKKQAGLVTFQQM